MLLMSGFGHGCAATCFCIVVFEDRLSPFNDFPCWNATDVSTQPSFNDARNSSLIELICHASSLPVKFLPIIGRVD